MDRGKSFHTKGAEQLKAYLRNSGIAEDTASGETRYCWSNKQKHVGCVTACDLYAMVVSKYLMPEVTRNQCK